MEKVAIPGIAAIIEKEIDGEKYILLQERWKADAPKEEGLLEIPAGKVREFESVFDCLRREVKEETGLTVTEIIGEDESELVQLNGYQVISYTPFSCAQNLEGDYPIMVETFICRAEGDILCRSNESQNIRWVKLSNITELSNNPHLLYPMHVVTLQKYLNLFL